LGSWVALFIDILDDSERYIPFRSAALTYVNLLSIFVELSGFDDESPPPESWFEKMAILGSPRQINLPVFK